MRHSTRPRALRGLIASACAVALLGFAPLACDDDPVDVGVTAEHVSRAPSFYAGQTVTVAGEVDDTWQNGVFELESDAPFAGDILVLPTKDKPIAWTLADDDEVRVTGTVVNLVTAEIERDYGFELTPEIEADFSDQAVLVATEVSVVERD